MRAKTQTIILMAAASLLAAPLTQAAVTLTDIGATAPTPGANDISQLVAGGVEPSSLNYYWDDGATTPTTGYPSQSFTTLNNPEGYILSSVAIQTLGGGGGTGGTLQSQSFTLLVFQLSNPMGLTPGSNYLTNATLIASFTTTGQLLAGGDWMQWTGLGVSLAPGTNYGFSFGRAAGSPADYEEINAASNYLYSGGQACLIANAGGKVKYASTQYDYDMTFDAGLSLPAAPIANQPIETPSSAAIAALAGTSVTLTATAGGSQPISFTWYTDGGTGGTLTNIPGADSSNLVVNTTGWLPGTYSFDFVASNSLGTNTSSVVPITVATLLMADIGTNTPVPGPYDISQLLNTEQNDDGLNYYTDDGAGHGAWAGQTFTTGTSVSGYVMNSLKWLSAGNGADFGDFQLYDLYIYSLNASQTEATQIAAYQAYGGGNQLDWFDWVGLSVALAPNTHYAYTFGRDTTSAGYEHIADQGGSPYPGGKICTVPLPAGGAVTYGTTGTSSATFDIGLSLSSKPFAFPPTYVPNVNPVYAGTVVTMQEAAVGPPPLYYQWMADNGTGTLSLVNGATGTNLVVNTTTLTPGNYEYAIIVSNSSGVSTSAVTTLTLDGASAPLIVTDISPTNANDGYTGETVDFSATFTGTLPITYQWYVNTGSGPASISTASNPTATNNTLVLTDIQAVSAGTYSVVASNSVGTNVSSTSTLTVLTPPSLSASGTYGAAVISNGPIAYWPLDDTGNPSSGVAPAYDASGHNLDGVYGIGTENGYDGILGPQPPAFPGFTDNNTALYTQYGSDDSFVTVPSLDLNTNTVTITMWINPNANQETFTGLFMNRSGLNDGAGLGFGGTENAAGMPELGYTWNTNNAATYGFNSGLYPVQGTWSFVALVVQSNQATIYLYYIDPNTGQPDLYSAANPIAHGVEKFTGGTNAIGTDPGNPVTRAFSGETSQVTVYNQSLTSDQILTLFSKAAGLSTVAPSIAGQPQSAALYAGKTVTLTATGINGTPPITYQWQFDGVNLTNGAKISGATSNSLTLTDVTAAESGTYTLLVINPVTTVPSSNAVVTVVTPVPGSYESSVLANSPLAYWKLDETNADPASGTAVAYDYVNGYDGLYGTGAQDGYPSYNILGPESPQFPGFPATNTAMETFYDVADSYMSATAGTIATNTVTYALWIYPTAIADVYDGLLMNRSGPTGGNGLGFAGDTSPTTGMADIGYTWNYNAADTWSFSSYLFPETNQWSLVAMVIEPSQATLYLINSNGVQTAVNPIAHDNEQFANEWHVGDDAQGTAGSRTFPGIISSVSVYVSALSSNQLVTLYDAGTGAAPPVSISLAPIGGKQLTLTWSQGTLLQATNLAGPWTTNTATSPYTVSETNSAMYFKVLVK